MAIYTKTGDKGITSLFDGQRISKNSDRVNAYGTFDELNAQLSVCEKLAHDAENKNILHQLQHILFRLCAEVATENHESLSGTSTLIDDSDVHYLEGIIDRYTAVLPELHSFILSGKFLSAAELHVARTVCRRAERLLIAVNELKPVRSQLLQFVNRLSDCIYILARKEDYVQFLDQVVIKVEQKIADSTDDYGGTENSTKNFSDIADLSLEEIALQLCRHATAYAKSINVPIVISVVDDRGIPIIFYRMNHALLVSNELAPAKAYTAVAFKAPTHTLGNVIQPKNSLFQIESMVEHKIVTFGGGYPITINGKLIGGLGVSGGTVEQDMEIASAALTFMGVHDGK